MWYKHQKTGRLYKVLDECFNATNAQDSQRMVRYHDPLATPGVIFVREYFEFHSKFVKLGAMNEAHG